MGKRAKYAPLHMAAYEHKPGGRDKKRRRYRLLWQFLGSCLLFAALLGLLRSDDVWLRQLARTALTTEGTLAAVAGELGQFIDNHSDSAAVPVLSSSGLPGVSGGRLISPFGRQGEGGFNRGVLLETDESAPITAISSGWVSDIRREGDYYMVVIDDYAGLRCLYGHCVRVLLKQGEAVQPGDTIGYTGLAVVEKGRVYIELQRLGEPINPLSYGAESI